jgi:ABC-2 type transport system permease protein
MRLFIETVRRSFRRHLTYRAAMLAGLLTNVFFGLLKANVFLAFAASGNTTGWNDSNIMTYTALTQALIVFLSIFGSFDLMNRVYRGEIAGDLLKPTPLYGFYLAQDLGRAVAALLLRGLPLMVVMNLFFEITIPNSIIQWCIVVISPTSRHSGRQMLVVLGGWHLRYRCLPRGFCCHCGFCRNGYNTSWLTHHFLAWSTRLLRCI